MEDFKPTEKDIRRAARLLAHLAYNPKYGAEEATKEEEYHTRNLGPYPSRVRECLELEALLFATDGAVESITKFRDCTPNCWRCPVEAANWRAWRAQS